MKRIILGLSLLLLLVQNGFAETDAEYDKDIASATMEVNKQLLRCNKATLNYKYTSNSEVCIKELNILLQKYPNAKKQIAGAYLNAGVLYEHSEKNYIKAYEYFRLN